MAITDADIGAPITGTLNAIIVDPEGVPPNDVIQVKDPC
jgi:hypothetical protein